MIKNLAITTPTIGSIRLGEVVEKNGKRLPSALNHFKITSLFKNGDGEWVPHPMHDKVAKDTYQEPEAITEIPVHLMFNNPELNMRARYEAFNRNGRLICAGDGKEGKRFTGGEVVSCQCPGSDYCEFGIQNRCNLFGRLNVIIDGQEDEFSSFILRTESVNSVRTLYAKMNRMYAKFGNRLLGIPFKLKLRAKASSASYWSRFFFVDLILNKVTDIEAVKLAVAHEEAMEAAGLNQADYEQEVLAELQNGAFEDGMDDFDELEPFLLARDGLSDETPGQTTTVPPSGDAQDASSQPQQPKAIALPEGSALSAMSSWVAHAEESGLINPVGTKGNGAAKSKAQPTGANS